LSEKKASRVGFQALQFICSAQTVPFKDHVSLSESTLPYRNKRCCYLPPDGH